MAERTTTKSYMLFLFLKIHVVNKIRYIHICIRISSSSTILFLIYVEKLWRIEKSWKKFDCSFFYFSRQCFMYIHTLFVVLCFCLFSFFHLQTWRFGLLQQQSPICMARWSLFQEEQNDNGNKTKSVITFYC